jgi:hypothetical protein
MTGRSNFSSLVFRDAEELSDSASRKLCYTGAFLPPCFTNMGDHVYCFFLSVQLQIIHAYNDRGWYA